VVIGVLFVHEALVETFLGAGPSGDRYSAGVTVRGFLDDGLVRVQSAAGEQLVQKSVFYAALADADLFKPESRVTVNGRAAQVSQVRRRSGGNLFGAVEHVEVDLS
jgi:hypothetical protein